MAHVDEARRHRRVAFAVLGLAGTGALHVVCLDGVRIRRGGVRLFDRPPRYRTEACRGRGAGDACTISHGDHAIGGTCASGPDGNGPLACRPEHAPPR